MALDGPITVGVLESDTVIIVRGWSTYDTVVGKLEQVVTIRVTVEV